MLDAGNGEYLAMADNGFGKKDNSADFLLRAYIIRPDFETAGGGSGEMSVGEFRQLRDPDRLIPFEIVNEDNADRLLTGGDFDIESVRRDPQGDLWAGDEFGPFLLHADATGRVLEAPIPLPDVKSPENPTLQSEEEPNLPTSKGFEGMAIFEDATLSTRCSKAPLRMIPQVADAISTSSSWLTNGTRANSGITGPKPQRTPLGI